MVLFTNILMTTFQIIVHRRDIPIMTHGEVRLGFSLWDYPLYSFILELLFFGTGMFLYLKSGRHADCVRTANKYILFFMAILLISFQITNSFFADEHPNKHLLHALWIPVILAALLEKSKESDRKIKSQ